MIFKKKMFFLLKSFGFCKIIKLFKKNKRSLDFGKTFLSISSHKNLETIFLFKLFYFILQKWVPNGSKKGYQLFRTLPWVPSFLGSKTKFFLILEPCGRLLDNLGDFERSEKLT